MFNFFTPLVLICPGPSSLGFPSCKSFIAGSCSSSYSYLSARFPPAPPHQCHLPGLTCTSLSFQTSRSSAGPWVPTACLCQGSEPSQPQGPYRALGKRRPSDPVVTIFQGSPSKGREAVNTKGNPQKRSALHTTVAPVGGEEDAVWGRS